MLDWVTVAEVLERTGATVTAEHISAATGKVEAAAFGRRTLPLTVTELTDDDLERMRRAVAWQAAAEASGSGGGVGTVPGARSLKVGDTAVVYETGWWSGASVSTVSLDGIAAAWVDSLSWMQRRAGPVGYFPPAPTSQSAFPTHPDHV